MISYQNALNLTLQHIQPLGSELIPLIAAGGRICGQELSARIDSPSATVSLKDGYALLGEDVRLAAPDSPVRLKLVGNSVAGGHFSGTVHSGEAVRILSGAPLPAGATAVVSEEFTQKLTGSVDILSTPGRGRNILPRGTDIHTGQIVAAAGQRLYPTVIGLLAAAGFQDVPVVRRPQVAVLATGDEVLAPGQPMVDGKLYASNLFTLSSWCLRYGFGVETFVLPDDAAAIREALVLCLDKYDAVVTSGGAWKGERDLVVHILDDLGWQKIYHRVRLGPGKAVGFGLYDRKPVFCLPGGPPSNHMAFLQLALPGLQKLAGDTHSGLPRVPAMLAEDISGQIDWTQGIHGALEQEDTSLVFHPIRYQSRLQEMARTDAVAIIPEGVELITAGSIIQVQVLTGPG